MVRLVLVVFTIDRIDALLNGTDQYSGTGSRCRDWPFADFFDPSSQFWAEPLCKRHEDQMAIDCSSSYICSHSCSVLPFLLLVARSRHSKDLAYFGSTRQLLETSVLISPTKGGDSLEHFGPF